jgi:hypothetical protein
MAPVIVFLYGFFSKKEHASWPKLLALTLSLSGTLLYGSAPGRRYPQRSSSWNCKRFRFHAVIRPLPGSSHHLGKNIRHGRLSFTDTESPIFWCILQNVTNTVDTLNQNHLWKTRRCSPFALL